MVLTNWRPGSVGPSGIRMPFNVGAPRQVAPFHPGGMDQSMNNAPPRQAGPQWISSNGYYGYSYINAAHANIDSVSHISSNNNNRCVSNANDVNGMAAMQSDQHVPAYAEAACGLEHNATQRCKKRNFVSDEDYANCPLLNGGASGADADVTVAGLDVRAAKRCRFDDAEQCNNDNTCRETLVNNGNSEMAGSLNFMNTNTNSDNFNKNIFPSQSGGVDKPTTVFSSSNNPVRSGAFDAYMDETGKDVAAAFDATHGGSFYQFKAAQYDIEDI